MNPRLTFYSKAIAVGLLVQTVSLAYADSGQDDPRRGPPPAAIEACAALTAGATCSFAGRQDQDITGTCFAPPEREMACRPDDVRTPSTRQQTHPTTAENER